MKKAFWWSFICVCLSTLPVLILAYKVTYPGLLLLSGHLLAGVLSLVLIKLYVPDRKPILWKVITYGYLSLYGVFFIFDSELRKRIT